VKHLVLLLVSDPGLLSSTSGSLMAKLQLFENKVHGEVSGGLAMGGGGGGFGLKIGFKKTRREDLDWLHVA